jgi:ABC-type multidrug transport system fused ATPase/permease subunit
LVGPISDFSVAMQVSRFKSGNRIENLIDVYQKKTEIDKFRLSSQLAREYSPYDESYIKNSLLQRLVETKFHDNALYFSSHLSEGGKVALGEKTSDLLFGILPQPILDLFKIDVDKLTLRSSMGDYLANFSAGIPLGGYRTGSIFAQGQALLGPLFILTYFMICIALFYIMSLLSNKLNALVTLSAPALLLIWSFFISGITAESLHQMMAFLARNFIQSVVIYLLVYWLCCLFTKPVILNKLVK